MQASPSEVRSSSVPKGVRLRRAAVGALVGAVLITSAADLTHLAAGEAVTGLWLLASAAVCVPLADAFARGFFVLLGTVSLALVLALRLPWSVAWSGAVTGGTVLVFLLLVEFLGAAIQVGGYDRALTALLARRARSGSSARRAAWIGAFILASAGMFMASVPAVYYALGLGGDERRLPLVVGATRGFAAAVLVNPLSPLVVIALSASGAPFGGYLVHALPVFALMLAVEWWAGARSAAAPPGLPEADFAEPLWQRRHTLALVGAVVAFALAYRLLSLLAAGALMSTALSVAAAAGPLGLAAPSQWARALRTLPAERFPKHFAAAPLFVVGGLFGNVLVHSGLLDPVVGAMQGVPAPWLWVPFVVALVLLLRWLGVAPTVSVLIVGPVLAGAVPITPALYALALVFGGVMAFLGSPLSGTNLFVAGATGLSPLQVSVGLQGGYVLATMALFLGYAWVLQALGTAS